jgi:hypothetical protein
VRQCAAVRANVCGSARSSVRQCVAVRAAVVCGSALGSACQCAWQCAAVQQRAVRAVRAAVCCSVAECCSVAVCSSVSGNVWQCAPAIAQLTICDLTHIWLAGGVVLPPPEVKWAALGGSYPPQSGRAASEGVFQCDGCCPPAWEKSPKLILRCFVIFAHITT